MQPSKSREDLRQSFIPTSLDHHTKLLERQSLSKKQQLAKALKNDEKDLQEYINNRVSAQLESQEFERYLELKRQELAKLNQDLEHHNPELYDHIRQSQNLQKAYHPTLEDYLSNPTYQKAISQSHVLSQEEIEREKRRRLRDDEKARRMAGVQDSAYQGDNIRNSQYELKNYRHSPARDSYKNSIAEDPNNIAQIYKDLTVIKEYLFAQKRNESNQTEQDLNNEQIYPKSSRMSVSNYIRPSYENNHTDVKVRNSAVVNERSRSREYIPKGDLFSGLGEQKGPTEKEKKRKYKEELDEFVRQKNVLKQMPDTRASKSTPTKDDLRRGRNPELPQNTPSGSKKNPTPAYDNFFNGNDKEKVERKNFSPVSGNFQDSSFREDNFPGLKESVVEDFRGFIDHQGSPYKHDISIDQSQVPLKRNNSKSIERSFDIEKKRKYKEDLDAFVEEKKKLQNQTQTRPNERSAEKPDNASFIFQYIDDEDQRKKAKKVQALKHAEELKKQLQEREERKRFEQLKKREASIKEREEEVELERKAREEKLQKDLRMLELITSSAKKRDAARQVSHEEHKITSIPLDFDKSIELPIPNRSAPSSHPSLMIKKTSPKKSSPSKSFHLNASSNPYGQNQAQKTYNPENYIAHSYPDVEQASHPVVPPISSNFALDIEAHRKLVQLLLQERVAIEKITMDQQVLIQDYQARLREQNLSKSALENEYAKLKLVLENPAHVDASIVAGNNYLIAIKAFERERQQHILAYNKLVNESQKTLSRVVQDYNIIVSDRLVKDSFTSPQKEIDKEISSSSYMQNVHSSEIEKSFVKDLEAFRQFQRQQMSQDFFNQDSSTISIGNPNISNIIGNLSPSKSYPKFDSAHTSEILHISTSAPNTSKKEPFPHNESITGSTSGRIDSVIFVSPHPEKYNHKDQTPQVMYHNSPDSGIFSHPSLRASQKKIADYSITNPNEIIRENPELEVANETITGKFPANTFKEMLKDHPHLLKSNSSDCDKKANISELNSIKNFESDQPQEEQQAQNIPDIDKLEIKLNEASQEKPFVIADQDSKDDIPADMSQISNIHQPVSNADSIIIPPKELDLKDFNSNRSHETSIRIPNKIQPIVEKARSPSKKTNRSIDSIKRSRVDQSKSMISDVSESRIKENPGNYESHSPNVSQNTSTILPNLDTSKHGDTIRTEHSQVKTLTSTGNEKKFKAPKTINPFQKEKDQKIKLDTKRNDLELLKDLGSNTGRITESSRRGRDTKGEINIVGQHQELVSHRSDAENIVAIKFLRNNSHPIHQEDLASTVDMNEYSAEELKRNIQEIQEEFSPSPKPAHKHEEFKQEKILNYRRSKNILDRLTKVLEEFLEPIDHVGSEYNSFNTKEFHDEDGDRSSGMLKLFGGNKHLSKKNL